MQNFRALGEGSSKKEAKEKARVNLINILKEKEYTKYSEDSKLQVKYSSPVYFQYECSSGEFAVTGIVQKNNTPLM